MFQRIKRLSFYLAPAKMAKIPIRNDVNMWQVNEYARQHSVKLTAEQKELIDATKQLGRMAMMIANPEVAQLNQNLMRTIGAKKVLEIGLFTGYNALSAALVLPPGGVVCAMDIRPDMYDKCGKSIAQKAGVEQKIQTNYAPALETLQKLIDDGTSGTWDYSFIDADKENYPQYYEMSLKLLRSGGIIALDNTLRLGNVLVDPKDMNADTRAIHELNAKIANDERIYASFLTIGDGLMLAFKR